MPAGSVDMVFTDPPYGHNNNNGDLIHRWEAALGKSGPQAHAEARPILNDGRRDADRLAQWLFKTAPKWLSKGSCCCCCCGGGGPDPQFARWSLWADKHLAYEQLIIWDKGPIGMGWKYRRSAESVIVASKKGAPMRFYDKSHRVENVIRHIKKIIPNHREHPTEKPVALAMHFILLHTKPGDTVFDPFMGRGSTGEAALRTGRKFIGIELDPQWFEAASARLAPFA